jgi:hypothetical protein
MRSRILISFVKPNVWKKPVHWVSAMLSVLQQTSPARQQKTEAVCLLVWGKATKPPIPVTQHVMSAVMLTAVPGKQTLSQIQIQ